MYTLYTLHVYTFIVTYPVPVGQHTARGHPRVLHRTHSVVVRAPAAAREVPGGPLRLTLTGSRRAGTHAQGNLVLDSSTTYAPTLARNETRSAYPLGKSLDDALQIKFL